MSNRIRVMLTSDTTAGVKSPLGTALLISFAIAAGTVLTTLDSPIFDEITSGRWLTRPFSQAQERNTASIAELEHGVGALATDLDFVTERVRASIRRGDDLALHRLTQMDATIAALNERIDTLQSSRAVKNTTEPADAALRPSFDVISAHSSALAAITKRLDRIEVRVGMSTDEPDAPVRHAARRKVHTAPQIAAEPPSLLVRTERVLLNLRPSSKPTKPLRVSTLRD
jgi:uncharacterized small protein (DUF1192 family)